MSACIGHVKINIRYVPVFVISPEYRVTSCPAVVRG
jgi:hypothetical protein